MCMLDGVKICENKKQVKGYNMTGSCLDWVVSGELSDLKA